MKQITSEQIKNAFDALSPDVSRALSQIKINDLASAIGKKNNLHVDQIGSLSGLVSLKIIGLLSASEFPDVVREELHLNDEQMIHVVDDVNTLIFKVLRERVVARAQVVDEDDTEEPVESVIQTLVVAKVTPVAPDNLPTKEEQIAMDEHSILKNSEIELEETPLIIPTTESSHIKSLDREELLKTLEHPPASASSITTPINTNTSGGVVFTPNTNPLPRIEVMPKSASDIPKVQTIIAPPIKVTQKIEPTEIPLPQASSVKTQEPQVPPTPLVSQGLVSDKLQSTFKLPQQESNYSLPKVGNSPSAQTSTDPYREAL